MAEDMLKFYVFANLAQSYVSTKKRLYCYALNTKSATQSTNNTRQKIYDMNFIANYLPSLSAQLAPKAPYAEMIAKNLIANLCALIILELRFLERKDLESIINALCAQNLESAQAINATRGGVIDCLELLTSCGKNLLYSTKARFYLLLAQKISSPYLCSCILSLIFWNRSLTFVRVCAFICTFGRLKL